MNVKMACISSLLILTVLCASIDAQLNFNLPSIFSRLSKNAQAAPSLPGNILGTIQTLVSNSTGYRYL